MSGGNPGGSTDPAILAALAGSAGIPTFPTAAAADDAVSIAEVLRYIQEQQIGALANTGGAATLAGILGDVASVAIATTLKKIDALATDGLSGTNNSLAYRIAEVERHVHSYERWYGLAASPNAEVHRADQVAKDIAPFVIDGGNDAYGAWVQVLGSSDTAQRYDLHKAYFTAVERASTVHFVQFGFGTSGAQALTDGTYTEFVYRSGAAVNREAPIEFQTRRQAAGTKAWARCLAYDADTGTLSFYLGLHYYEG